MNLTPTELSDLFAEAQRMGRPEHLTGYRFFRAGLRRPTAPPSVAQARLGAYLPPLPAERVQTCACGGYLELRAGLARPVHVGPRGCTARR